MKMANVSVRHEKRHFLFAMFNTAPERRMSKGFALTDYRQTEGSALCSAYLKVCGLPFKPLIGKITGVLPTYFKQISNAIEIGKKKNVLSNGCNLHIKIIYTKFSKLKHTNKTIFLIYILWDTNMQTVVLLLAHDSSHYLTDLSLWLNWYSMSLEFCNIVSRQCIIDPLLIPI